MLMHSSRRYLPLSLALLLAASTSAAQAGSSLDPYAHIKKPAPVAGKKKSDVHVPNLDDMETTTYTTTIMGSKHFEEPKEEKKGGRFGLPKVGGIPNPFKGAGSAVASGTKKFGGGLKKTGEIAKGGASSIGSGVKAGAGKVRDGSDTIASKVAKKPKKEKGSANKVASVDDWYVKAAGEELKHGDGGKRASALAKIDPAKETGSQKAFLAPANESKLSKLNPFNKLAKKPSKKEDDRPASGFMDAADNPDPAVLAEIEQAKAEKLAAKKKKESENKFAPIANLKEDKKPAASPAQTQVASTTAVNKQAKKKSKFGGFSLAKLKPSMPSVPGLKKDKAEKKTAIAAKPAQKADSAPSVKQQMEESSIALDPNEVPDSDVPESAQPSMAFKTGDKAIDNATARKPQTNDAPAKAIASKPEKTSKAGGMSSAMKGGFNKFNFLNKKKQPQAQNAPKQM